MEFSANILSTHRNPRPYHIHIHARNRKPDQSTDAHEIFLQTQSDGANAEAHGRGEYNCGLEYSLAMTEHVAKGDEGEA